MVLKNFSILYVEDSKTLKEHMKDILSGLVKELFIAKDGKEGLSQYALHKPDIIITDINMPNIDGLQMAKIIRKSNKDIPIIFCTDFENIDNLKQAISINVHSFIHKPIKEDKIIQTLTYAANDLQNKIDAEKLKKFEMNQEKISIILNLLHEIGHHWRQPLTTILTLSSSYELKKRNGLYKDIEEEIKDINFISQEIQKLSSVLNMIEKIDIHHTAIEDLEKLIKISNPIYN